SSINKDYLKGVCLLMRKIIYILILGLLLAGCSVKQEAEGNSLTTSKQETEINILATTDLHGNIPNKLVGYIETGRKKDENLILVDAGDFFDLGTNNKKMKRYFDKRRDDTDKGVEKYIEAPMAKEMVELGYDAIVLGNHEFMANNKFHLDNLISDFDK